MAQIGNTAESGTSLKKLGTPVARGYAKYQGVLPIKAETSRESRPDTAGIVGIDDILDTGVSAASKDSQTDNKAKRVESGQSNVLFKVAEEGDGFGDDPSENDLCDEHKDPDGPTLRGVGVADRRVLEDATNQVAANNCCVDGSRNEDDGKCDTEGNTSDDVAAREKGGTGNVGADESVDESTSDGVDDDLNDTKSPDGLNVIFGSKDNALHETAERPPGASVDWIPVAIIDGELCETGRNGQKEQKNSRDGRPNKGADSRVIDNANPSDGTGQSVRSREQDQMESEHCTDDFHSDATEHETNGIRIVLDMGVLELDLSDDVTSWPSSPAQWGGMFARLPPKGPKRAASGCSGRDMNDRVGRQAYQRRELGIGKCNCVQVRDVKEELTNNETDVGVSNWILQLEGEAWTGK
ncbi:N amino acid transport system protein, partial [Aureobasidium melanogenum]